MKQIVIMIVNYLKKEMEESRLNSDAAEALEVAIQCLESAYGVTSEEVEACSVNLDDLYLSSIYSPQHGRVVSEETKDEAASTPEAAETRWKEEKKERQAIGSYTSGTGILSGQSSFPAQQADRQISAVQQLSDPSEKSDIGFQPQAGGSSTSQQLSAGIATRIASRTVVSPCRRILFIGAEEEEQYGSVGPGGEAPSAIAAAAAADLQEDSTGTEEESEGEDSVH